MDVVQRRVAVDDVEGLANLQAEVASSAALANLQAEVASQLQINGLESTLDAAGAADSSGGRNWATGTLKNWASRCSRGRDRLRSPRS